MDDQRSHIARPTGWFCIGTSDEVRSEPRPLHHFGVELVVYRGESGQVVVFDAYCAHMGAHLGIGGRVTGDDIICPYHGWRWDRGGEVVEIPYSSRLNRARQLKGWSVLEQDGLVFIWHDECGGEPAWEPPSFAELGAGGEQVMREDTVRMFPEMAVETAVDPAHVAFASATALGAPTIVGKDEYLGVTHHSVGGDATAPVVVECWGVGVSRMQNATPMGGTFFTLATPVDDERTVLRTIAVGATAAEVQRRWAQLDRDIAIWENQRWARTTTTDSEDDADWAIVAGWAESLYSAGEVGRR
ncbi:Rieske 2Fe-2S domain-containing protein [Sporichthya sp.]|uniref:aromatic ring-hydroxylating dioxygenase subunit alpha n=1 Tax=Sporichthya sp. TaxID=65475 RepID=UPI00180A345A|nr:Rieske 2Fe-2S domain-containing protein [Sporichthya sp.]MBA3741487.1 Rieske 2Fe-2S domain-containing protein [Sporichthya sp.]